MNWFWLLLLACPIMMILMMNGMRGRHHQGTDQKQVSDLLYEEMLELRDQNEILHNKILNLEKSRMKKLNFKEI